LSSIQLYTNSTMTDNLAMDARHRSMQVAARPVETVTLPTRDPLTQVDKPATPRANRASHQGRDTPGIGSSHAVGTGT
jgi:hypothetical protein